jgi:hypothetical protein
MKAYNSQSAQEMLGKVRQLSTELEKHFVTRGVKNCWVKAYCHTRCQKLLVARLCLHGVPALCRQSSKDSEFAKSGYIGRKENTWLYNDTLNLLKALPQQHNQKFV